MTPQLVPQTGSTHLTIEQFDELLARTAEAASPATIAAEAHLLSCPLCAAELAGLRDSLSLFCQASTAHAEDELSRQPLAALPARRPALAPVIAPAYWAAAAALILAAFLPLQTLRHRSIQPAHTATAVADSPAQSDEALLDDIDREASASVPTPMQALVDPTATSSSSIQTSSQRKD